MSRKRITSVTTRGGDSGQTSLADGTRLAKSEPRIHAIGSVDELNSFIGLLVTELVPEPDARATGPTASPPQDAALSDYQTVAAALGRLQQELFDLGAHLATAGATQLPAAEWLDDAVVEFNSALPPLTEFVIPGGTRAAALCHVCRTVCRRAERHAWEVDDAEQVARYLNRLSDVLFVAARLLNRGGDPQEPQWRGLRQ